MASRLGDLWRRLPGNRTSRSAIVERLERLERLCQGGHATYLGNNRLLTRLAIENFALAFFVEADDRLMVPRFVATGLHEPALTRFFAGNVKATDNCLDIGANFGYYTCLLAKLASNGKTIGIEPQHHVYELLRDNIIINGLEINAAAINAAIGASKQRLTLFRRHTRSGNTSIIRMSGDDVRHLGEDAPESFEVEGIAVDDLLGAFDQRIDFIKLDVEGAEPLVFRGAHRALAANPQIRIVMEWSPGQIGLAGFDPAEFVADLARMRFNVALVGAGKPKPITFDRLLSIPYYSGVLLTIAR